MLVGGIDLPAIRKVGGACVGGMTSSCPLATTITLPQLSVSLVSSLRKEPFCIALQYHHYHFHTIFATL